MARRYYSSTAVATTLSGSLNNSSTSVSVTALSGFPNSTPWTAIIDKDTASEEVVTVTNVSGTTLTVTRGVDGTTAVSHNAGASFSHGVSARDFDEANSHVNDTTTDVHSQYIVKSLVTNKGSLVAATAASTPADLPVGSNGQMLMADSSATAGLRYVDPPAGRRLNINGGFDVWQRGTSFVDGYSADRYKLGTGGTVTVTRDTDVPSGVGFRYSIKTATGAASSFANIFTAFEEADVRRWRGLTLTFSAYAKRAGTAMTGTVAFSADYSTSTDVLDSVATPITGASVSTALTTSWARYSVTFTVPSDAVGMRVSMQHSDTQASGVNVFTTGWQLEFGPVATPFEFEPYGATLRKCQRYYYRHTPGAAGPILGTGWNSSTTKQQVWTPFPVAMRSAPTALEQNGTASHYKVAHAATTTNLSAVATFVSASTMGAQTEATVASGLTAGQGSALQSNDATAYLAWSAEL